MAFIPDYQTGTVSLTTGTKALVGVGTAWVTAGVQPGDLFFKNGFVALVDTVNNDTSITLRDNWGGATLPAGTTYSIKYAPDQSRVQASVVALINSLSGPQFTALRNLNISTVDRLVYTDVANSLGVAPLTPWARTLLDDADAGTARGTLGAGGTAANNTWTGDNTFTSSGTLSSFGTSRFTGILTSNGNPLTDMWSVAAPAIQYSSGWVGSGGSSAFGLYYNGYRNNASNWTSLGINGSTVGMAIEMHNSLASGIRFSIESPVTGINPSASWILRDDTFFPAQTNTRDIGSASIRVRTIYLVNNPNVSSDARYKLSRALTPAEVAAGVQMGRESILYQWRDKVAAEGAEVARLHAGVEAQTVARIMADNGLDVARYGFWCVDPLTEPLTRVVENEIEEPEAYLGADGQPATRMVKRVVKDEIIEDIPVLDEEGEQVMYQSIRYGELAAFIAAAQAAHMDNLEARIAALEAA